ncbi:hypothetical protein [Sulfurisphaera javensis]
MEDDNFKRKIIKKIKRVGGNLHYISYVTDIPISKIQKLFKDLLLFHKLSIFPLIEMERIGLNKAVIWCKKTSLKYETAKSLMGPLASLFRGDLEENKFLLMFYTNTSNYKYYKENLDTLFERIGSECEILYIKKYYRYINDEEC